MYVLHYAEFTTEQREKSASITARSDPVPSPGIAHIWFRCRVRLLDLLQGVVVIPAGPCSYNTAAATALLLMRELARSCAYLCTVQQTFSDDITRHFIPRHTTTVVGCQQRKQQQHSFRSEYMMPRKKKKTGKITHSAKKRSVEGFEATFDRTVKGIMSKC